MLAQGSRPQVKSTLARRSQNGKLVSIWALPDELDRNAEPRDLGGTVAACADCMSQDPGPLGARGQGFGVESAQSLRGVTGPQFVAPLLPGRFNGGAAMNRHAEQVRCDAGAVQPDLEADVHAACCRKRRARGLRSRWPDVHRTEGSDRSGRCQMSSIETPSRGTSEAMSPRVRLSRRRTSDRWVLDGKGSG